MTNNGTDPKRRKFFDYVSAYHELIAILIFFAGVAAWTIDYFATKSDVKELRRVAEGQIERLHCMLRLNVEWLAGEQVWKITNDELTKIEQEIRTMTPMPGTLPDAAVLNRIVEMERLREEKKKDMDFARVQKNESRNRLMRNECGQ